MSFLGLFPFTAPYLPWVLLSFSILLGNSATTDLIGIVVGHIYYFLEGEQTPRGAVFFELVGAALTIVRTNVGI